VVSVLEGGYSLEALRESVAAHVAELMKTPST
jgi:acetoin utilization deacetylase AcuC-like enzyme